MPEPPLSTLLCALTDKALRRRARRARAALADIALLGATLEGYRRAARRVDRVAAGLVVPYLAWVSFAAFLNAQIVRHNPRLLGA